MAIEIRQFPCLADNYGYLVRDRSTGAVATIDTPDAAAIDAALDREGWRLTHILNTHWHADHAGGNLALKERWGCRVVGPAREAAKIPGIDLPVGEGDCVSLGDAFAIVRDTPGHTLGHVIYHFTEDQAAFVGDTLFALGCGRLFEGSPETMWASLGKLRAMAADTLLYCAHEYTQANAKFALAIDPDNKALRERVAVIERLRAKGAPTVPSSLAEEIATNPFLTAATVEEFARRRSLKDNFR